MSDKLLVTGASGQLGRLVIDELLARGIAPERIVATTRKPEALAALAARGIEVRAADFDDSAALTRAFAGVQRLLLISTDALDAPGKRLAQHRNAVQAAVAADVRHVVYTSMPRPEPGSPVPFAPDHYGTEQALAASPLGWTVLRNCWYMQNLLAGLRGSLPGGQWYSAAGEGRVAYVSREDCARAAAAALASESSGNATYDITGPEALTTVEIAGLVSEIANRPLAVVPVTPEALGQGLAAHGVPGFFVPVLVSFDVNTAQGNVAQVSDAVQRLTGRAPQRLADFLKTHRAELAA